MKKIIMCILSLFLMEFIFSQQRAIIGDYKVNVRNSPSLVDSKVLYQLNAGDEITIYSSKGDFSFDNGITNYWYKISQEEEWINAEFVYTFPCDFVSTQTSGLGEKMYERVVFQDYKIENDNLYFQINYVDTFSRSYTGEFKRWEKASDWDWIGNKSKNAESFIYFFTNYYNKDFFNDNLSSFVKEDDRYNKFKLEEGSDTIVFSDEFGGGKFYLFEINISDKEKTYPYGIKIGMKLDEFIKKLGGYDAISEEKGFMLYQREETYQMTVYFNDDKITRINLYCGV